jgi:hypothetical protein
MAASVAHEGNPRTNSLAVTGTLDGEAWLIPIPTIPVPTTPLVPIIENPVTLLVQSSVDPTLKYVFTDFVFGNQTNTSGASTGIRLITKETGLVVEDLRILPAGTVREWSCNDGINMYGCVLSKGLMSYDQNTNFTGADSAYTPVNRRGVDFYQMLLDQQAASSTTGAFGSAQVEMTTQVTLNAVNGSPISGVAVMVDPESTPTAFTGIVAAYDWSTTTLYLSTYNKQPLSGFGTVISSAVASPALAVGGKITALVTRAFGNANSFAATARAESSAAATLALIESTIASPYYTYKIASGLVNIASSASHVTSGDDDVTWEDLYTTFVEVSI